MEEEKVLQNKKHERNNKSNNEQNNYFPQYSDILSISSNPEDLFTLLYPIGHGGFGTVYKAIHNSTNRVVAIKIIDFIKNTKNSPIDCNKNKNLSLNYYSVQQETSLMKLGNKSKYIVNYYGSYFSRNTSSLWLILEYCSSGSAIDLMIAMNRTFTEIEISTIMENVLQGLIIIHSMNLIHRDIKGANILLSEDGYAKLGDFGVGIRLIGGEEYRKSKKGSPYWMSPQVVNNINYDMKTDIWSLGITCAELSNGEPPFSNLNPKNVMEKIAKSPPTVDDIIEKKDHTEEFYDFIKKCLEIDPKKRPNAKELIKHHFITKYSKGHQFLAELIFNHTKDIERIRKIINNSNNNRNKINEENSKKNNFIGQNDNYNNNLFYDNNNKERRMIFETKNLLNKDIQKHIHDEDVYTSHFNNEEKFNEIKKNEKLLLTNKNLILFSSSLENLAINSTKDSQINLKNSSNIKNDSDKIIYINYNLNNNINDSSSEHNNQNFTTFHREKQDNDSNSKDNIQEENNEKTHYQCASFDKNYLFFGNEIINSNKKRYKSNYIKLIKSKNNNIFYKPSFIQEKKNYLYDKKNYKLNSFYKNKNISKKNAINKSNDNIFLKKNSDNINNFIYKKKKIRKNNFKQCKLCNKSCNDKEKVNEFNKYASHKKQEINTGCISFIKKEIESIGFDISNNDEEGNINQTNLFRTKSNLAIFENENFNNLLARTNYDFYKNKNELHKNNIYKSQRNYLKNNNNDFNEYEIVNHHINSSKKMNKIHQKYFEK